MLGRVLNREMISIQRINTRIFHELQNCNMFYFRVFFLSISGEKKGAAKNLNLYRSSSPLLSHATYWCNVHASQLTIHRLSHTRNFMIAIFFSFKCIFSSRKCYVFHRVCLFIFFSSNVRSFSLFLF